MAIYLTVIAALFAVRRGMDGRDLPHSSPISADADRSLRLHGSDLAPTLVRRIVAYYRRDYPDLDVQVHGGGTSHALEALLHHRADVAFLSRPPSRDEQRLFVAAEGDTAVFLPVAIGGIVLVRGERSKIDTVTVAGLRDFLGGDPNPRFERLYVPDPNFGLWDALRFRLEISEESSLRQDMRLVFLADQAAVVEAVEADDRALGVVSSLAFPADDDRPRRPVAVYSEATGKTALPTYEEIGSGVYPLFHYLYVACLSRGGIQAAKFVTHVTSGHGQRQIERTGVLPAREVLREVYVTERPVGESR